MKEVEYLMNSLSECLTVTLSTEIPFLKTSLLFLILKHLNQEKKPLHLLDLDLQFSSMIASIQPAARQDTEPFPKLVIYRPNNDKILDSMISLLSQKELGRGGAIVIDSVNSMQDLLRRTDETDSSKANHKSSIVLSLFQQLAKNHSKLFIVSNIARSRPHLHGVDVEWEKELVGGRMIKLKSDVVISITGPGPRSFSNNIKLEVISVSQNSHTDLRQGQIIELRAQPFVKEGGSLL